MEIANRFILPGDTLEGAALDLARTVIRRAERMAVKLLHDGVIHNGEVVHYLNRLSDLVFILARYLEVQSLSLATRPQEVGASRDEHATGRSAETSLTTT